MEFFCMRTTNGDRLAVGECQIESSAQKLHLCNTLVLAKKDNIKKYEIGKSSVTVLLILPHSTKPAIF